jgi:hypothetical protein
MTTAYTEDQMTSIGGNLWAGRDGNKRRVYFNDWPEMAGFRYTTYNSGNISSASINGETLANGRAAQLVGAKVYWENGEIHTTLDRYEDVLRRVSTSVGDMTNQIAEAIAQRVAELDN